MAGNQVLEWTDLDSEIKTAGLKNVRPLFNITRIFCSKKALDQIGSLGSSRFVSSFDVTVSIRYILSDCGRLVSANMRYCFIESPSHSTVDHRLSIVIIGGLHTVFSTKVFLLVREQYA